MYRFTVCGRGEFPYDMLRKEQCHPASQGDSDSMSYNVIRLTAQKYKELRAINLIGNTPPNRKEWESFGWHVMAQLH